MTDKTIIIDSREFGQSAVSRLLPTLLVLAEIEKTNTARFEQLPLSLERNNRYNPPKTEQNVENVTLST